MSVLFGLSYQQHGLGSVGKPRVPEDVPRDPEDEPSVPEDVPREDEPRVPEDEPKVPGGLPKVPSVVEMMIEPDQEEKASIHRSGTD